MAIIDVLTFPNAVLRKKSAPVTEFNNELTELSNNLLDTMYDHNGIGLAAVQIGELKRVLIIDTRPREGTRNKEDSFTELEKKIKQPLIIVNPQITFKEGSTSYDEGCLSVPSYYETVKRFENIKLSYQNLEGKELTLEVDGLLSICIQHEIDHLDGKLFIDRLSTIKSTRIKSKIKKFGYPEDDTDEEDSFL